MGNSNFYFYQGDAAILAPESTSAVATSIQNGAGAVIWGISVPMSLSAHPSLDIQVNFSNIRSGDYIVGHVAAGVYAPGNENRTFTDNTPWNVPNNPEFEDNWVTVGTLSSGSVYWSTYEHPVRWVRLKGTVSGSTTGSTLANFGSTGFKAFFWTDVHVNGV